MKRAKKASSSKIGIQVGQVQLRATISQTKNNLSALIDRVRHGETVLIFDRDEPVARLVPVADQGGEFQDDRLVALERGGLIRRGTVDPRSCASGWQPVKPSKKVNILEALLQDRGEDWR